MGVGGARGGPGRDPDVEAAAERAARNRDARLRRDDPARRKRRGVVATPRRLAAVVARRLDDALRGGLGLEGGLADPRVALIDPAVGTGTFLAACVAVARDRRAAPGAVSGWDVDRDALDAARDVLDPAFARAGWPLDLVHGSLVAELPRAGRVYPEGLVPVVVGNPPWAGKTANRGATDVLLEDFRVDERGARLDERKLGVLSDDYVRFFRVAVELLRQTPEGGALALVTNASFLDGPVHRGMRAALLRWLDAVQVFDLGGSALVARSGARDENLFDVRPAAAVTVAWREARRTEPRRGRLEVAVLRGSAAAKLSRLESDPGLGPGDGRGPAALFRPRPTHDADAARYASWVPLPALMPFHREGVQTNRDAFATDVSLARLLARLGAFARGEVPPELDPTPRAHFDAATARAAAARILAEDPRGTRGIAARRLAYRPDALRWFVPVAPLCHRPRPELLRAFDAEAAGLVTVRKDRGDRPWAHFGWVDAPPDNCWLSSRSSCRTRVFPVRGPDGTPNLDRVVAGRWAGAVGRPVTAPEVARYALAVIATPAYRALHDAVLRLDPPRLPPPPSRRAFEARVAWGEALAGAFLRAARGAAEGTGVATEIGHRRVAISGLPDILDDLGKLRGDLTAPPVELTGSRPTDTLG